ncbi:class D beta-lactamase [Hahella sp. CR1]|uniref:class D beta-lactamase n=1 Tax=Hahella sp. CR1 TaxID=2992807 RepID=UPI0024429C57|nr:class D beta-lactamase [Hahella sp. CR1]MDG9669041.1 class D beta-lactamase [Hahella sp. CR1]
MLRRFLTTLYFLCFCSSLYARELTERSDWREYFRNAQVQGVFVLCKQNADNCQTSDLQRASEGFVPASTFKILEALIALETGVLKDGREVFHWDGQKRPFKIWEDDFSLRGAMQNSVEPVFQELAIKIGEERMRHHVAQVNYGNADISGSADHFWLDGALRISAAEQIEFLSRLYYTGLPFSERNQLIVQEALLTEAANTFVLRSKTGYSLGMPGYNDATKSGLAWWVGWVEKGADLYFFAANFDIDKNEKLAFRKSIPRRIMTSEGILP